MTVRGSRQRCSMKKVFLEISQYLQENTCARVLFFNKVADLRLATVLKKTLAQVFSCDFCEISNNTFFTEHLWITGSGPYFLLTTLKFTVLQIADYTA